jgi:hypothetical protein
VVLIVPIAALVKVGRSNVSSAISSSARARPGDLPGLDLIGSRGLGIRERGGPGAVGVYHDRIGAADVEVRSDLQREEGITRVCPGAIEFREVDGE